MSTFTEAERACIGVWQGQLDDGYGDDVYLLTDGRTVAVPDA